MKIQFSVGYCAFKSICIEGMTLVGVATCLVLMLKVGFALLALEVKNRAPFEQRTSETFSLELRFDPLVLHTEDIMESRSCMKINGHICHCFDAKIHDISFYLTELCLQAIADVCDPRHIECSYWFSMHLLLPKPVSQYPESHARITRTIDTSAVHITAQSNLESLLTLVLPLTLDDLSRASVLLHTLQQIPINTVHELLVFVPDNQHSLVQAAIQGIAASLNLQFAIRSAAESTLFARGTETAKQAYPYAIQMAVKLIAARLVRTPYYVTLDADVVLLRPFIVHNLIPDKKAIYHFEERSMHENWWRCSERLLHLSATSSHKYQSWQEREACTQGVSDCSDNFQASKLSQLEEQGFGVTPAVMSTFGSLLTLSFICQQMLDETESGSPIQIPRLYSLTEKMECEQRWIVNFGRYAASDVEREAPEVVLWSEYTLYRVVLDHLEVNLLYTFFAVILSSWFVFFFIIFPTYCAIIGI